MSSIIHMLWIPFDIAWRVILFVVVGHFVLFAFVRVTGQTPYGLGKEYLPKPKSQKPSEESARRRFTSKRSQIIHLGFRGRDGKIYATRDAAIKGSGGLYGGPKLKQGSG